MTTILETDPNRLTDPHEAFVPAIGHIGVSGVGEGALSVPSDGPERTPTLETLHTRSLAHIEMTGTAFVSFTSLEHYNPQVPPSRETYPIPAYLNAMLTDSEKGSHTYRNTVEKSGWQIELRDTLADYLHSDSTGQQLAESLNIRSLSHLTPEQAVKLSAAFVQDVSKYTTDDVRSEGLTRADQSTAIELLREGIAHKNDPNWQGNGVCRNVASDVKAVFEALKATQGELSMLNNTYAVYGAGVNGAGYADAREDTFTVSMGDSSGHAWDIFVTVDAKGSAVATILDATWALDSDTSSAIQYLDQTEVRAASQLMPLFEMSEVKQEAFIGLTDYVQKLLRSPTVRRQLSEQARADLQEYVTTEYLRAAAQLPELPDGFVMPEAIVGSAYRLRGKLERNEIETLFALDKASGGLERGRIKAIIAGYDAQRKVGLPGWKSAENLIFDDGELQALAFDAVGPGRIERLADQSGAFRARLREYHPEVLPPFNAAEHPADARELSYFAGQNGIYEKDPDTVMRRIRSTVRQVAGNDSVYEAIVIGRTDYDLAKNCQVILRALRGRPTS